MRIAFAGLVVLLATSAARAEGPDDSDSAALVIDAGRLVVMVDQSEEALAMLAPGARVEELQAQARQDDYAFYELVSAVTRYDLVRQSACGAGVVDPKLCGGAYEPLWLKDASDAKRSGAELRAMIDQATAHIMPLWTDLCARGRRVAKDEHFCQIE